MADWTIGITVIVLIIIVAVTVLGFTGTIQTIKLTGTCQFPNAVCNMGKMLGIPDFFLTNRNFMFYFLMPLGAIGAIVYGFLDRMHLFRNTTVNVSIAIFIALASVPTQVLTMLAATMLTILGTYAVGAFVVVFVVGVFLIVRGTISQVGVNYAPIKHQLQAQIDFLQGKIDKINNSDKSPAAKLAEVEPLERLLKELEGQAEALNIRRAVEKKK